MRKEFRIITEEAIRTMAIFGVLLFGAGPLARRLGVPAGTGLLAALVLAVLAFLFLVPLRMKTGWEIKVASRRGWIVLGVVGGGGIIVLKLVYDLAFGNESPWSWPRTLVVLLMAAVWAWVGARWSKESD